MERGDSSEIENKEADSSVPDVVEEPQPSGSDLTATLQALGIAIPDEGSSSSRPRSNYISWDDLFMSAAFLIAMRSKDPVTQVSTAGTECSANL